MWITIWIRAKLPVSFQEILEILYPYLSVNFYPLNKQTNTRENMNLLGCGKKRKKKGNGINDYNIFRADRNRATQILIHSYRRNIQNLIRCSSVP